ncbi:hypothetical protein GCM10023085_45040 [Actinomadura viridis]|uniref:Schlafen AlbA-2 domain-containing protein n=1 Tax=Actinomadura viridis TaxID=58110 RepID=A0A931DLN2_9ACTN|nr:ATP-binding protein [Actinomadura viridis]MBG6089866.1 hypothetical protein [Actinomadura viridis]
MAFQSTRLSTIFGASPESVTYEQLEALISNDAAREAEDLDYKRKYETGDKGSDDVAVDITTFANHLGGVIVVGMAEVNAQPSKIIGIELTDELERWIHTRVADRVFPKPRFRLRRVPDPTDTSQKPRGLLLIMVPRSSMAPHAVVVPNEKEKLRWPRRQGTGKIWLTEGEIAAAYRQRFVTVVTAADRLSEVQNDNLEAIARKQTHPARNVAARLTVSLVPDIRGNYLIDHDSYQQFLSEEQRGRLLVGNDDGYRTTTVGVGYRRLVCTMNGWLRSRSELHTDGAGSFTVELVGEMPPGQPSQVWDSSIVLWTASGLRYLARHARDRASASGGALTSSEIMPYGLTKANEPAQLGGELTILTSSPAGPELYGRDPQPRARGEAYFLLDHLADDGQPLAQATAHLVGDLFQTFNAVSIRQITRDGELDLDAWGSERAVAEAWATQAAIPLSTGSR